MATLTVEISEELSALADLTDGPPARNAAKLLALELFREGRASLGRAAELAGISIEDFMEFSAQRQVPLHYTADDWVEDRETAVRL